MTRNFALGKIQGDIWICVKKCRLRKDVTHDIEDGMNVTICRRQNMSPLARRSRQGVTPGLRQIPIKNRNLLREISFPIVNQLE
jgi:hypothetical protein